MSMFKHYDFDHKSKDKQQQPSKNRGLMIILLAATLSMAMCGSCRSSPPPPDPRLDCLLKPRTVIRCTAVARRARARVPLRSDRREIGCVADLIKCTSNGLQNGGSNIYMVYGYDIAGTAQTLLFVLFGPISLAVVLNTAACCTVALSDQAAIKNKVLSFQVAAERCYQPTD